MKLIGSIGDNQHVINISWDDGNVVAKVDDRKYILEASSPEANIYLFKHENRIFEVFVSAEDSYSVRIRNDEFEIDITDPKSLRNASQGAAAGDGIVEIKTAMPGKVVRILSAAGATIKDGEGIVVVEAMKMQNEMKSPKEGVVKEIRFSEGDTVKAGDVLAIIE